MEPHTYSVRTTLTPHTFQAVVIVQALAVLAREVLDASHSLERGELLFFVLCRFAFLVSLGHDRAIVFGLGLSMDSNTRQASAS